MSILSKINSIEIDLNLSNSDVGYLERLEKGFQRVYKQNEDNLKALQAQFDSVDQPLWKLETYGNGKHHANNYIPHADAWKLPEFVAYEYNPIHGIVWIKNKQSQLRLVFANKVVDYLVKEYYLRNTKVDNFEVEEIYPNLLTDGVDQITYRNVVTKMIGILGSNDWRNEGINQFRKDFRNSLVCTNTDRIPSGWYIERKNGTTLVYESGVRHLNQVSKAVGLLDIGVVERDPDLPVIEDSYYPSYPVGNYILGTSIYVDLIQTYQNQNAKIKFKSEQKLNEFLAFYNIDLNTVPHKND